MPGVLSEQVDRLEVAAVHGVDLAGFQGVGARRHVHDREELDLVEVGAMGLLPVVLVTHESGAHSGLEVDQLVATAADPGSPVYAVPLGRQDRDVVVADEIREVRVPAGELYHHGIPAFHLDALHGFHQILRGGLRILVPVVVDRGHHVVRVERLAVVELHPLADLEPPGRGVRRCLPALGQLRLEPGRGDLGEVVVPGHVENRHVPVLERRRVEGIRRRAVRHADPELPALLRGGGERCLRQQARGHHPAGAEGACAGHEIAPAHRAHPGLGREGLEF